MCSSDLILISYFQTYAGHRIEITCYFMVIHGFNRSRKLLVVVSNAISVYSIYTKNPDAMPKNTTLVDFILKATPENLKKDLNMDLIDDVFSFVSKIQSELS